MEDMKFIRAKLRAAQKSKKWNEIAKATDLTRTTFYSIINKDHVPNGRTIDKLVKYFKKGESNG